MGLFLSAMLRSVAQRFPQGIRSLASKAKAKAEKPVEVPVRLHGLDGRYATSLYSVAVRKGAVDAVEADLIALRGSLGSSKALSELVANPSIPKKAKVEAIDALNAKSGFADPTKNLLALMAENNRLSELENIADKYDEMLRAARGQILPRSLWLRIFPRHRQLPSRSPSAVSWPRVRPSLCPARLIHLFLVDSWSRSVTSMSTSQ